MICKQYNMSLLSCLLNTFDSQCLMWLIHSLHKGDQCYICKCHNCMPVECHYKLHPVYRMPSAYFIHTMLESIQSSSRALHKHLYSLLNYASRHYWLFVCAIVYGMQLNLKADFTISFFIFLRSQYCCTLCNQKGM